MGESFLGIDPATLVRGSRSSLYPSLHVNVLKTSPFTAYPSSLPTLNLPSLHTASEPRLVPGIEPSSASPTSPAYVAHDVVLIFLPTPDSRLAGCAARSSMYACQSVTCVAGSRGRVDCVGFGAGKRVVMWIQSSIERKGGIPWRWGARMGAIQFKWTGGLAGSFGRGDDSRRDFTIQMILTTLVRLLPFLASAIIWSKCARANDIPDPPCC